MTQDNLLRILISNDDGIESIGTAELANALAPWCDATVVVPDRQRSAASHAVTLHKPLRLIPMEEMAPTDSVLIGLAVARLGREPDLIISGINAGDNTAEDVSYSGTVAAAIEGAMYRIPSVAVSFEGESEIHYHLAALATLSLVESIAAGMGKPFSRQATRMIPERLRFPYLPEIGSGWPFRLLNVNIPDLPEKDIKGWMATSLGKRDYKDLVIPKDDPRGRPYYWIAGEEVVADDPPGSDLRSVREGYISITPLLLDYTDYAALDVLRQGMG